MTNSKDMSQFLKCTCFFFRAICLHFVHSLLFFPSMHCSAICKKRFLYEYWILMHMLLVVTIFGSKKEASSTLVIRRQYEFMLIVAICPVKRVCRRSACVARLPPAGQTKFTQFSYLVTKVRFDHARIVVTFINLCDFAKITQFRAQFNSLHWLYLFFLLYVVFKMFVFLSLRLTFEKKTEFNV